jgi:hypothetical protein
VYTYRPRKGEKGGRATGWRGRDERGRREGAGLGRCERREALPRAGRGSSPRDGGGGGGGGEGGGV